MKKLRQSTVKPVFGSLTQFYGLRKIGVLGKAGAHKVMLMAAIAFNLKKYLKKGGKPPIGIFKTIMDAFQDCLTFFCQQLKSRPILLKRLKKHLARVDALQLEHFYNSHGRLIKFFTLSLLGIGAELWSNTRKPKLKNQNSLENPLFVKNHDKWILG